MNEMELTCKCGGEIVVTKENLVCRRCRNYWDEVEDWMKPTVYLCSGCGEESDEYRSPCRNCGPVGTVLAKED